MVRGTRKWTDCGGKNKGKLEKKRKRKRLSSKSVELSLTCGSPVPEVSPLAIPQIQVIIIGAPGIHTKKRY